MIIMHMHNRGPRFIKLLVCDKWSHGSVRHRRTFSFLQCFWRKRRRGHRERRMSIVGYRETLRLDAIGGSRRNIVFSSGYREAPSTGFRKDGTFGAETILAREGQLPFFLRRKLAHGGCLWEERCSSHFFFYGDAGALYSFRFI